jgi:Metal binding domain of Ada
MTRPELIPAQAAKARPGKRYTLLGPDRTPYPSRTPGRYGGYRPGRRYGRLDCPAALRAIARGGYVQHRVFFADEATAIGAGYRPCAVCLPERHAAWKARAGNKQGHNQHR